MAKEKFEGKYESSALKNNVVNEMVETERKYNEKLAFLAPKLVQFAGNNQLLQQLSKQINLLLAVSEKFLLNAQKNEDQRHQLINERAGLLKAFFEALKQYLPLYTAYMDDFAQRPQVFEAINNALQPSGLQSLLVEPIQRGPRYYLLVQEALKNTEHLDEALLNELTLLTKSLPLHLSQINQTTPVLSRPSNGSKLVEFSKQLFQHFKSKWVGNEQTPPSSPSNYRSSLFYSASSSSVVTLNSSTAESDTAQEWNAEGYEASYPFPYD